MVTKVGLGQRPKLEITALQELERVEVMLNRDDGKNVGQNLGAMGVGETREVLLDGNPASTTTVAASPASSMASPRTAMSTSIPWWAAS